jgi:type III pantothenate kinase
MLFVCNVENTNITVGVMEGVEILFDARIATACERSADEYALLIASLLAMHQVSPAAIHGAILASVVRPLGALLSQATEQLMQIKPLLVGPGVKTGLNIKTDIPSQVGADIVANAVGALTLAESPLVFVDFGTATTLTGINEKGELCGVIICPGVRSSLDALSDQAAELPSIALESPRHLFGKNTIDAMESGVILGHASMVDGLLDRIAGAWNNNDLTIIATGGHADKIIPHCRYKDQIRSEPHLAFWGLRKIYGLNGINRDIKAGALL